MSETNPWKTLSSKIVYKNPWITVREDSVIRPDGARGIYSVVETRIAAGVVAMTPEKQIYLVGQYRYATNNYSWEIIEGGSDKTEDPMVTAKRELQEEAGLIANTWVPLGSKLHLTNCHSSEVAYLYLATDLKETKATPEGTEVLKIKTVPFEEALRMAMDGSITDAMSIIALHRIRALNLA